MKFINTLANDDESYHAGLKNRFNEFRNDKPILSTCCHPTKMRSLEVTYMQPSGGMVTHIMPNMIVSACGCS